MYYHAFLARVNASGFNLEPNAKQISIIFVNVIIFLSLYSNKIKGKCCTRLLEQEGAQYDNFFRSKFTVKAISLFKIGREILYCH
jgi:hypothetical protein